MAEHSVSIEDAQKNLLTCAVYLAENVGSREARAAAMETIIAFYIEGSDVDTAAELADSVDDPFIRDRLLAQVVLKCGELNDDEYALQLIDAIDEHSTRNTAREQFALQKARNGEFEVAKEMTEVLDHSSDALAGIAVHQAEKGFEKEAFETLESVDFYNARIDALMVMASRHLKAENAEKAVESLDRASAQVDEIEFVEDRIRSLFGIGDGYIEAGRNDKAIEIFAKARDIVADVDGVHKDNLFVNAAIGFMKAGSVELADRALDLVTDKTQIADCLIGFSRVSRSEGDSEEALEALEEAYAMLKSQSDLEIRSTKARFQLFGAVAREFAENDKIERAIEIAQENPDEQLRNLALTQISQICVLKGNGEMAEHAVRGIEDESQRVPALVAMSDAYRSVDSLDETLSMLNKAYESSETIPQYIFRSEILNELAVRFNSYGDSDKARAICSKNVEVIKEIRGEGNRAVALAELSEVFRRLGFELKEEEMEILKTLTKPSQW